MNYESPTIIGLVLSAVMLTCFAGCGKEEVKSANAVNKTSEITQEKPKESSAEKLKNTSPKTKVKEKEPIGKLEKRIHKAVKQYPGTWSVYVKDLKSGKSFSINNRPLYAASLIKIYTMGSVYQSVKDKRTAPSKYIHDNIRSMITVSSNDAFNTLAIMTGFDYINNWSLKNGFKDTHTGQSLYPSDNGDMLTGGYGINTTSVKDCGKFLNDIYYGKCINKKYSKKMMQMLLAQKVNTKIPKGIPKNAKVRIAHKTGETEDVSHDCGIVYSKGGDYIICVMSSRTGSGWANEKYVRKISSMVYKHFNP